MKNTQEGFYNRYELAEERTGELKDVSVEIMQSERRKKKRKLNRSSEKCGVLLSIQIYA